MFRLPRLLVTQSKSLRVLANQLKVSEATIASSGQTFSTKSPGQANTGEEVGSDPKITVKSSLPDREISLLGPVDRHVILPYSF